MLWSIDSCQNKVSADQYHLTVSRAQVRPIEVEYFFEVIRWQVTGFQMIVGSSLFFKNLYEICCVDVTIAPHYWDFGFKLTTDAKIQPVI